MSNTSRLPRRSAAAAAPARPILALPAPSAPAARVGRGLPSLGLPRKRLPISGPQLQGLAQLGVDATLGITHLVEAMHHTILARSAPLGRGPQGAAPGLTGGIYRMVRGITRLSGLGLHHALGPLGQLLGDAQAGPQREAALAVLNGVWGDHLADSGNPLAIQPAWRLPAGVGQGTVQVLAADGAGWASQLPRASGRVLVLLPGLCMHDGQFLRQGQHHGLALQQTAGYSPVGWHYNSGRHVSQNGAELARQLELLLAHWPVPVERLVILGHSMGGLVARSAIWQAEQQGLAWRSRLHSLVCLGTPHHGAPLERGGHLIDRVLGFSPYAAPLARLGLARSAGITDLRFGNVQDADWHGRHAQDQRHDDRRPTPLPAGVRTCLVAASTSTTLHAGRSPRGDGLVPLASALGHHRRAALALHVPAAQQMVLCQANHWDLLSRPAVTQQLVRWLV